MVPPASWEKLQHAIAEGTNANAIHVLLTGRYPLLLSDLNDNQDAVLRRATQASTPAVVALFTCACTQGNLPWVEHLQPVCGISCVDHVGDTPLCCAARGGHVDVVQYLAQCGVDVLHTTNPRSPLCESVDNGHTDVVEFLLHQLGEAMPLNAIDTTGYSLLHLAVRRDDLAIVSLLLSHGVDVNAHRELSLRSGDRHTLLSIVRSVAMARLLLNHGADFSDDASRASILSMIRDAKPGDKASLLTLVTQNGVDIRDCSSSSVYGAPLLHEVCQRGQYTALQLLLELAVDVDVLSGGCTPLHTTVVDAITNKKRIVQLLLKYGADPTREVGAGEPMTTRARDMQQRVQLYLSVIIGDSHAIKFTSEQFKDIVVDQQYWKRK